ncbi:Competence transcription factor [Halalkalibacter krulwichiae]|uniref:Competence transcription factor n=1 Tax=Halalkalibacter krulwichiae TaxID=199441 RepID=A0A1X9M9K3_9BACI|nr:competence protein ComK [Halalkalibacter krulwichiae]ARK30086.1 Competence transcription factor [Halalkalibacter krulwichiae]
MESKKEYVISPDTMVIGPIYNENGYLHSIVMEVHTNYKITKKPYKVMKDSCHYYGSNYNGIREATTQITGFKSKVPICISHYLNLFFFPLESPKMKHAHGFR